MSEALRLADLLEPCCLTIGDAQQAVAAAELRRLHAENEALQSENRTLVRQNGQWQALNAELVEALRNVLEVWVDDPAYGHGVIDKAWELLVKAEASK